MSFVTDAGSRARPIRDEQHAAAREPDAPRERLTDGRAHPVKVARVSDSGRMRP